MKHFTDTVKRLSAALSAAVILLSCSVCAMADDTEYETVESPVPQKVLVIGDSITTGFALEGYDKGRDKVASYANLLKADFEKELTAGKEDFRNKGIDGQESNELFEDLKDGKYDKDLENCDLVLISIGGNDLMHTLFRFLSGDEKNGITLSDIINEHSVGDIVKMLSDLNKLLEEKLVEYDTTITGITDYINDKCDARIIVQTLYNPVDTREKPKLFMAFVRSKIDTLNEKMINNAKDENGNERYEIADVFTAFAGQGDKLTNINQLDIHPNADGHRKIYETLSEVIRQKPFTIKIAKEKEEQADDESSQEDDKTDTKTLILIGGSSVVLIASVVIGITLSKKERSE